MHGNSSETSVPGHRMCAAGICKFIPVPKWVAGIEMIAVSTSSSFCLVSQMFPLKCIVELIRNIMSDQCTLSEN